MCECLIPRCLYVGYANKRREIENTKYFLKNPVPLNVLNNNNSISWIVFTNLLSISDLTGKRLLPIQYPIQIKDKFKCAYDNLLATCMYFIL